MIVIICTKHEKNPSRVVDATEWTRISKSRPNDLDDIGQGQRSLCATHPLMVVIICSLYGKNPPRTVDVTERTRQAGQTDGRSETNIPPPPQKKKKKKKNVCMQGSNNQLHPTVSVGWHFLSLPLIPASSGQDVLIHILQWLPYRSGGR